MRKEVGGLKLDVRGFWKLLFQGFNVSGFKVPKDVGNRVLQGGNFWTLSIMHIIALSIATLSHQHIASLPHYRINTLSHYHIILIS